MKNFTKVLAVAVVATMALSSISVFAAETETNTTELDRPAFSINVGARKGNFKFGKRLELTEEQKAAMSEKIASGEFKPMDKAGKGMRAFAKKAPKLNANSTEVAE